MGWGLIASPRLGASLTSQKTPKCFPKWRLRFHPNGHHARLPLLWVLTLAGLDQLASNVTLLVRVSRTTSRSPPTTNEVESRRRSHFQPLLGAGGFGEAGLEKVSRGGAEPCGWAGRCTVLSRLRLPGTQAGAPARVQAADAQWQREDGGKHFWVGVSWAFHRLTGILSSQPGRAAGRSCARARHWRWAGMATRTLAPSGPWGRGGEVPHQGHREPSQAGREAGRSAVRLQHVWWRRDAKWVWGTGQHKPQPYRHGGPQTGN